MNNESPETPALSVRQPWAWLIVAGIKDVENRTRNTKHRGRLLIHASKWKPSETYLREIESRLGISIDRTALQYGGVIGEATVTGSVTSSASKWFAGPVGWTLIDAKPLPFHPCNGNLGMFYPVGFISAVP